MLEPKHVEESDRAARKRAIRWYIAAMAWPVIYLGSALAWPALNGSLNRASPPSPMWSVLAVLPVFLFLIPGAIGDRILAAARIPCPTCNRPLRSRDARWALQTGLCPGCRKPMINVSRPRSPVAVARLEQRRQRRAGWVTLWSLPAIGMACAILVRGDGLRQAPQSIGSTSFFPLLALTLGVCAAIRTRRLRYLAPSAFAAAVLVLDLVVLS